MKINVRIGDGVVSGAYLWFSNVTTNGLFRINIVDKAMEFVGFFPNEQANAYFIHKRCFEYNKRLFFIPALSRHIDVYDIVKNIFISVPFKNDIEGEAVLDATQIGNNLYIFPRNSVCKPLVLDMNTLKMTYVDGLAEELDTYVLHNDPEKFYRTSEYDKKIVFPLNGTDIIAIWSPIKKDFKVIHTGINKIVNVLGYKQKIFFTLREEYGLKDIDLVSKKIETIDVNREGNGNNLYGCIINKEESIICAPSFGAYIHEFNNGILSREIALSKDIRDIYKFFKALNVGEELWFLPMGIDDLFVMDESGELKSFPLMMEESSLDKYKRELMKNSMRNNKIVSEFKEQDLSTFMNVVCEL